MTYQENRESQPAVLHHQYGDSILTAQNIRNELYTVQLSRLNHHWVSPFMASITRCGIELHCPQANRADHVVDLGFDDLDGKFLPYSLFEEVAHLEHDVVIRSYFNAPQKGLPVLLADNLPVRVKDEIKKMQDGIRDGTERWWKFGSKLIDLVNEFIAKKQALETVLSWNDSDISRMDITEQELAEETVLNLLTYCLSDEEDRRDLWLNNLGQFPNIAKDELISRIMLRLHYLDHPSITRFESAKDDNFLPDGSVALLRDIFS